MNQSILDLIKRNTPDIADAFVLEKKESVSDFYSVSYNGSKILLSGNNNVTLSMAYYRYLTEFCGVQKSWCGNFDTPVSTAPAPGYQIYEEIPQKRRVFFDYITYSENAWQWDWNRWEKEIDFMAMNGINMALNITGNEALLFYTLVKLDFSESEALGFVNGPAFFAWQMTKKTDSYMPSSSFAYIERSLEMAGKIVSRMKELDISPVFSTFSGLVPKTIAKRFYNPGYKIMPAWCSFNKTYHLDLSDPLFRKFNNVYLEQQAEYLGKADYYMCTQLCNYPLSQKKKDVKYLEEAGRSFDHMMDFSCENATLVFPSDGIRPEFLSQIKQCGVLILDMDASKHKETDGFWGYDFILGNAHSNSPHVSMRGDIQALADNPYAELCGKYPNLAGTGLFVENLEQNPLYMDLSLKMLTLDKKIDLDKYLADYTARRYACTDEHAFKAVLDLKQSCYSPENGHSDVGSTLCTRPSLQLRHTAIMDRVKPAYDNRILLDCLENLLKVNCSNDSYLYDLCCVTWQVLDNYTYLVHARLADAYRKRDRIKFETYSNLFLDILADADRLLCSNRHFSAKNALENIKDIAYNDSEKNYFELNILTQLTVWGPLGEENVRYDCGWKPLGGLMDKYYHIRWRKFFELLANSFGRFGVQERSRSQPFDRDAYAYSQFHRDMSKYERGVMLSFNPDEIKAPSDTKALAQSLFDKYKDKITDTSKECE